MQLALFDTPAQQVERVSAASALRADLRAALARAERAEAAAARLERALVEVYVAQGARAGREHPPTDTELARLLAHVGENTIDARWRCLARKRSLSRDAMSTEEAREHRAAVEASGEGAQWWAQSRDGLVWPRSVWADDGAAWAVGGESEAAVRAAVMAVMAARGAAGGGEK